VAVLTALIIVNSAVFSVRVVNAHALNYCANDAETVRINTVIEQHHGIRMGSSMFTLNENRAIGNITRNLIEVDALAGIEIRAIERLFPNRIVVHYIRLVPYFFVMRGGEAFVFSNSGVLIDIVAENAARSQGAIELRVRGELSALSLGEEFATTVATDATRFATVVAGFERVVPRNERRSVSYVDITADGAVTIRMGVVIEVRSLTNFTEHFRHGFSLFYNFAYGENTEFRYRAFSGRILVTQEAGGRIIVSWSA